ATEPQRRRNLQRLAARFREALAEAGVATLANCIGPIVPIVLQSPERAVHVADQLRERGFLVGAIRPPSVPPGTSRLRISLSSAHTSEDIHELARGLGKLLAGRAKAS
ncbi:MAG TPA: aminotransferase class I/II-fold pyridoxal phosphate-dependent enzyme, partial [Planctomycetaceae bacterium]|nr:aminotransferase class I/II-fold pyridoxal phosphate-dependent enzyme [Planctomycetaceae bacterium]